MNGCDDHLVNILPLEGDSRTIRPQMNFSASSVATYDSRCLSSSLNTKGTFKLLSTDVLVTSDGYGVCVVS